jgi:hypothetical protein
MRGFLFWPHGRWNAQKGSVMLDMQPARAGVHNSGQTPSDKTVAGQFIAKATTNYRPGAGLRTQLAGCAASSPSSQPSNAPPKSSE